MYTEGKNNWLIMALMIVFVVLVSIGIPIVGTKIMDRKSASPQPTFVVASATPISTTTNTPTSIPSPTYTPTFTPTATLTLTSTPDLRIITIDPKYFLLTSDDLPEDAQYYIPASNWMSPHHNSEIISGWGKEEGLEYLEKTGRIDGWIVYFYRGSNIVRAPQEIFHNIIQYETIEGARITIDEYNQVVKGDYNFVERDRTIGDVSLFMIYKEMQSSGEYAVFYRVEIAYRNYVSIVVGFGLENDVNYEYVEDIAEIALEKLKAAELSSPP